MYPSSCILRNVDFTSIPIFTSSNLQSTAQAKEDSANQKTTELSSKIKTMQESQQQAIQSSVDDLLKSGVESLNQAKTSFNTVIENIKIKNNESSLSVNNDIEQKTQSSIETVDAIAQSFKPKLGELNQSFAAELDGIVDQIQQNIDVTKMDVRASNKSQADKYIGFSEEIREQKPGTGCGKQGKKATKGKERRTDKRQQTN